MTIFARSFPKRSPGKESSSINVPHSRACAHAARLPSQDRFSHLHEMVWRLSFLRKPAPIGLVLVMATAALAGKFAPHPAEARAIMIAAAPASDKEKSAAAFVAFVEGIWPDAKAAGVSRETFDAAFAGVHLDKSVLEHMKKQAEFERSIRDYLASAVSERQVDQGRALSAKWADTLAAIERRFGVDRHIIIALWGLESGYGTGIGGKDVIGSLASLAFIEFRGGLFRDELIDALVILQEGHVVRDAMKGSWAGAMGQAQF